MHYLLLGRSGVFFGVGSFWVLYYGGGSRRGYPQGPIKVGTGNCTPEVPELPSAWRYSWATRSPGVTNTER
jgi:hypothetical protein